MVQLFIDGGGFMWPILFIFIIGFVFVGERLYHLIKGLSANEKFAIDVVNTLENNGIEQAKDKCNSAVGPVANLCFNALEKADAFMNCGLAPTTVKIFIYRLNEEACLIFLQI